MSSVLIKNYPKEKIKGNVVFDYQLERRKELEYNPDKRSILKTNEIPNISTKCKVPKLVTLNKMKGRKDDLVNKDITMLQYDPNVDIVKERTTKGLLSFDKMPIRRDRKSVV